MADDEEIKYFFGDRGDGKMVCVLPGEPWKRKKLAEYIRDRLTQDITEEKREEYNYVLAQLEQEVEWPPKLFN